MLPKIDTLPTILSGTEMLKRMHLWQYISHHTSADDETAVAVHQLEDIVAIILSWLHMKEIMRSRRVCKKWSIDLSPLILIPSYILLTSPSCHSSTEGDIELDLDCFLNIYIYTTL